MGTEVVTPIQPDSLLERLSGYKPSSRFLGVPYEITKEQRIPLEDRKSVV